MYTAISLLRGLENNEPDIQSGHELLETYAYSYLFWYNVNISD